MVADDTPKPIGNPAVVLREEFDDWAVLFDPDSAAAVGVNPVGVAIWRLLDGGHDVDAIVVSLQDRFAGVPEAAREQVSAFIDDLEQRGFVGYEVE